MPKARKRKAPVTSIDATSSSSSTPQSSRTLIRQFHVLIKRKAQLQNRYHDAETARISSEIDREIEELGGLSAYQRMSSIGQGNDRGGGSEKVLITWLKEDEVMQNCKKDGNKLKLLEVGALKPDNYGSCSSWIDSTPMDLRSRHPDIMEQDFLLMNEEEHREKWDGISLSLVLNFVPEPKDRGKMLRLAHSMIVPGGFLFLALPLPCVTNSRYLTFEHLDALMNAVGFVEVHQKWKKGGKMAYWLYRKETTQAVLVDGFSKKNVVKTGDRNNFSILL